MLSSSKKRHKLLLFSHNFLYLCPRKDHQDSMQPLLIQNPTVDDIARLQPFVCQAAE